MNDPLRIREAQAHMEDSEWIRRWISGLSISMPPVVSQEYVQAMQKEIFALRSAGVPLFAHIRGDICLLAEPKLAEVIMPEAALKRVEARFTLGAPFTAEACLGTAQYAFEAFRPGALRETDQLLAAYPPGVAGIPAERQVIWLHDLLHTLSAKHLFIRPIKRAVRRNAHVPILVLQLPPASAVKQNLAPAHFESHWESVYLFGGRSISDPAFTRCVQEALPSRRVINCANFDAPEEAGRMLSIIEKMDIPRGDAVILCLEDSESLYVPFQGKYIGDDLIKMRAETSDYEKIAHMLRDWIRTLFSHG